MTAQMQTMISNRCHVTRSQIIDFCQRWHVVEFAVFGSVLRDDFHDGSDIDVLVTLAPNHGLNLFDWIDMQQELEALFNREVDRNRQTWTEKPLPSLSHYEHSSSHLCKRTTVMPLLFGI